jgi:HAD superfamily hydrolase (TIGR01509 family)
VRGGLLSAPDARERDTPFPLPTPPALVIFDCDGVLVDSERIQNAVLADMLGRRGVVMSEAEVVSTFIGLTIPAVIERVRGSHGVALGDDWIAEMHAATRTAFERDLKPVPGVHDLIRALEAAGVPFCVGSNGTIPKMHMSLGLTGLLPHLEDRLFSGEDMERGKPFPDLFLHAAAAMGAVPAECVVIEDSGAGLAAARAAGMRALAFLPHPHLAPADLAGGHPFHDMRHAPTLLGLAPRD